MKKYFSEIILLTKSDYYEELACWLEWHLNVVKFDHVVLFDNESNIDVLDVCKHFPEEKIEYHRVNGWPDQYNLYNKHLESSEAEWVITLDDDEYFYVGKKYDGVVNTFLTEIKKNYEASKCYVLWTNMFSENMLKNRTGVFLSSHNYYSYEACKKLSIRYKSNNELGKCFTYMGDNRKYRYHNYDGSSIGHIPDCLNNDNTTILETGKIVTSERVSEKFNENCFIAHYQYKTEFDWMLKCNRVIACKPARRFPANSVLYDKIFEYKDTFKQCNLLKNRWKKLNPDLSSFKDLDNKNFEKLNKELDLAVSNMSGIKVNKDSPLFQFLSEHRSEQPLRNTIFISAFVCCGKTYFSRSYSSKYKIIDLDDLVECGKLDLSELSGEKKESINEIYRKKLLSCIGKYDFVLVSVKLHVLATLHYEKLPYILCYPEDTDECYKEWERRNRKRGTSILWQKIRGLWKFVLNRLKSDKEAIAHIVLNKDEYLSSRLKKLINEEGLLSRSLKPSETPEKDIP